MIIAARVLQSSFLRAAGTEAMLLVFVIFPSVLGSVWGAERPLRPNPFPRTKPLEEVVRNFGYDLETHTVETSDGYLLTLHRLLCHSRGSASDIDRGVPLLIVTGALQSSASMLAKDHDFVYGLVDRGFDVWLSNYRGNMYSHDHLTLSPSHGDYWNFTLHEMGTKDLPAVIDFVLATSHRQQLLYQGYSMGTTLFWIMASSLPHYQNKVAAMVALAPIARPSHSLGMDNVALRNLIYNLLEIMMAASFYEVFPYKQGFASTINLLCNDVVKELCRLIFERIKVLRSNELEVEDTFKLIPYTPAGISTRVVIHYFQIINADRFQQYNYGLSGNKKRYGTSQPPEYDLKKINLPIYFIYSDYDEISTPEDIEWLAKQLPRRPQRKIMTVKNFRHADFSLNKNKEKLLTMPLLTLAVELAEEHRDALACVNNVEEYSDI